MKRFLIIGVVLLLLGGCRTERGYLSVTLTPAVTEAATGEEVLFDITLSEEDEFTGNWSIYDSHGVRLATESLAGSQFSYLFPKPDTYTVKVQVITRKDYGNGYTEIIINSTLTAPEWKLTDNPANENSFMAGEQAQFDLSDLRTSGIASIDVRVVNSDTGTTVFFEKGTGDLVTVSSRPSDYGNYKIVVTLVSENGSKTMVEDQLIILNPANPIKILVEASDNDAAFPDDVRVTGVVSSPNPLVSIELVRTAYYGRESGIYPLAEPLRTGGVEYSKAGIPVTAHEERYVANAPGSPLLYDEMTETFTFDDPMNYYAEDGSVEQTGFQWTYARFDREAWKYIKRRKEFNLTKALSIEYRLQAVSDQSDTPVYSVIETGYPYLSTSAMAQLCLLLKEAALNRLWHMQVPRYCYSKSSSWLQDGQTISSALGDGYVTYSAGLSGGSGKISNYSDWSGIKIYTNQDIAISGISLDTNKKRTHSINTTVVTPLYPSTIFKINSIGVRDYTLQWGLWITGGGQSGTITLQRGSTAEVETLTADELVQIMPTYEGWTSNPGYGYDEKDYTGITDHVPSTWTKINFKYPPTPGEPESGVWASKEGTWSIYYEVE